MKTKRNKDIRPTDISVLMSKFSEVFHSFLNLNKHETELKFDN